MTMRVAVDFDDTLCETQPMLVALTNFKHGTSHTPESISSWDWWRTQGSELEKTFWDMYNLFDSTHLRRAFPPVPFATETVKELIRRGNEVAVVTMNKSEALKSIRSWLWAHGLEEIPIRCLQRKSPTEKLRLRYDIFIDDSPKLIEAMRHAPTRRLILLQRPWNASVDAQAKNIFRARDWREVYDILKRLGADLP